MEHPVACQGCGAGTTTAFQCPLCQAEGATDRGFFCSQECFAKKWLEHRNTLHRSGVVRERKPAAAAPPVEIAASKRGAKRARAAAEGREGSSDELSSSRKSATVFPPWPALPSATACAEHHWATVTPALPLDVPRAVVRPAAAKVAKGAGAAEHRTGDEEYLWAALLSAAQYTVASVKADAAMQVLVVAGDVYSAHAFAWAARCVGLTGMLQLAVASLPPSSSSDEDESAEDALRRAPCKYFTPHKRVVIATSAVVRAAALRESKAATAVSGAASLWLTAKPEHALLLTLPDVTEPADLQGVQTRAVFFTGANGTGEDEDNDEAKGGTVGYTYSNVGAVCDDGTPLLWRPLTLPAPGTSVSVPAATANVGGGDGAEAERVAVSDARQLGPQHDPATRFDDESSTCLANGDLAGALHRLVHRYECRPGHFESTLYYLLCANWGAASIVHAHHRLAYIARFFSDQSARFEAKKDATLADAALRAVAAVVRLLPRMRDAVAEDAVTAAAEATESKGKRKKTSKTASVSDAAADEREAPSTMPTLATTTRPALPITDVSPPSTSEVARLAGYYTHLPNVQLQATVCHLYAVASPAVLDTFARAWGLHRYLPGPSSLVEACKARSAAVLRVRQRYTTRLDARYAEFLVTLMHLVYDTVGPYSLSVDELRRRLQWDLTLAHDAGSLESYLQCCALLPNAEGLRLPTAVKQKSKVVAAEAPGAGGSSNSTAVKSLSSRQQPQLGRKQRETPQSRIEKLRCFAVKTTAFAEKNFGFIELPWRPFPITGERQRQVDRLHKAAMEEVLMAMPRVPRPMYIGDVGNLIGKWAHFNARFDGALGATLQVFLEAHPEAFRVVGLLVTRRTAGTTEPVRIRFDAEEEHGDAANDDSDDERTSGSRAQKGRDRQLLTGQGGKSGKAAIELPARARKKRAVKEFNRERFNRNYKSVDPSARVPGYVKRGPRRIKGRGRKANKRVVKRGN
ncbi:hypothetical protein ABL78_4928 [Leptomonas seymouri]|uniref:C6H2-type domain-containing protein n=1 Tax=Leptomonas seymouri TaxID=5684 RepID=A0A0N1PBW4_LEPSE|nr:hypothetical protein ABL78_4928 [Leptomonas seymouri]|eukprot:KPI86025.1 hypothetical protein ABL78_4928 [Leptomonas seymouri]